MPSPSTSIATLRNDLNAAHLQFDLASETAKFVWPRLLPVYQVNLASAPFPKVNLNQLLQTHTTARAPKAAYARGDWTFTSDTYTTKEHGWEEVIDDNQKAMYQDLFRIEAISALRAFDAVLRNAEIRVAAALFNASTYTPTSIVHEWDDAPNAVPITDVKAKVQAIADATGIWPNALVINKAVAKNLATCAQIVDRLKFSGFHNPTQESITAAVLAEVFDLDHVIVGEAYKNTAGDGAAASLAPVWSGEYAWVGKIATTEDLEEPCIGRTFHWTEDGSELFGHVETYRDETRRGDIVRVRHQVDEKVLYAAVGGLFDNVTT